MKKYDLIIIGGGGGLKLVKPSMDNNWKIAVIEKDHLGGTCLNRGCIPSKMLIHPADIAYHIKDAKRFDIKVDEKFQVNFAKLTKRINQTISLDSKGIAEKYNNNKNIDYFAGTASFVSDKVVTVNGVELTSDRIVIATGSRPMIPPIPGLTDTPYMTSTQALKSKKLFKKLIVIGGGYIGVELGYAYSALGSEVNFMVRGGFVPREDKDVKEEFTKVFEKNHKVHYITNIDNISYKNDSFTIKYTDKDGNSKTLKGDGLLIATGVVPNTDNLKLENTKIKTNKRGFIEVDSKMNTGVKGVYAIGDCVGNFMFRHSVNFEAEYLTKVLFENYKKPIVYPPMPHAIFTNPQVAGVGKTEDELIEEGIDYVVGLNKYKNSAMGMALLSEYGFVKLLFEKKTQKLLGAHIIGEEASDMIHMLIAFITMGAKLDDLLNMIYVHPALPEIVRNAARAAKQLFEQR